MFKKKLKIDQNPELTTQVNKDLIVHNMPSATKLAGTFSDKSKDLVATSFKSAVRPKNNFKMIGLVIIIGGLIFIGGLVYLSYVFIIKSAVSKNQSVKKTIVAKAVSKVIPTSSSLVLSTIKATTSKISLVTSTVLSLASTTKIAPKILATSTATTTLIKSDKVNINNLPSLLDSDKDGLNNFEEAVLGTSATSSDTNNNSYPDLVEVNNNYNPIGIGRLKADTNLSIYNNKAFNYQILYPKDWPRQSLNKAATVIFTAPDNSLIQVSVQNNSNKSSISTWYGALFPKITPSYNKLKSTKNWTGIWGEDNLNFYLTDKLHTKIFIISYIPALAGRIVYPNIFKLMINSFWSS